MSGTFRNIRKIVTGRNTVDGAGVKLVRVIGPDDTKEFDPFLMLDAFDSVNPDDYIKGFPWHPHRGIETITYLIQGDIEHGDSLGNKGSILDGECQWMTAGSGIIHQEMPKPSKRMLGTQLWLNLPAKDKMTTPAYHGLAQRDIPVLAEGDCTIRILAGSYKGKTGAMKTNYVKALYLDIDLQPGAEWTAETNQNDTVFTYIVQGEGVFGSNDIKTIHEKQALLFDEGEIFRAKADGSGMRLLLFAAEPLHEPIAWGGPIVMNTQEELDIAEKELQNNTFIKN